MGFVTQQDRRPPVIRHIYFGVQTPVLFASVHSGSFLFVVRTYYYSFVGVLVTIYTCPPIVSVFFVFLRNSYSTRLWKTPIGVGSSPFVPTWTLESTSVDVYERSSPFVFLHSQVVEGWCLQKFYPISLPPPDSLLLSLSFSLPFSLSSSVLTSGVTLNFSFFWFLV